MKDSRKILNLLGAGLDSELAQKAVSAGFTLTKLRRTTKNELVQHFANQELELIWEAVKRKPIPRDTLQRLVKECDWKCCICWDYQNVSPVIVHHIEEHSKTSDDSYDNLVILCLNHHALAHSEWEISRHPLPPELICIRKREWIEALAEFKAGRRPAPGCEAPVTKWESYISTVRDEVVEFKLQSCREFAEIKSLLMQRPPIQKPEVLEIGPSSLPSKARSQFAIAQSETELVQDPSNWRAWLKQAVAYYELEEIDKALVAINKAWELSSQAPQIISTRGCILAEYAIARKGPKSMLNEAISLFESLRDKTSEPAHVDYNIGNCFTGLDDHQKAIEYFGKALAARPDPDLAAKIWKNRGTSYFYLGNEEEEIVSYKRALELNPNLFEAYSSWAAAELRNHHFRKARSLFEEAFKVDPDREMGAYPPLYSLAYTLWQLGDLEEAYRRVNQVLALQPTHQDGLLLKAYLLRQLWRQDVKYVPEAISFYENWVLDNPEGTAARNELYLIYHSDEYQNDPRSVLEQTALSSSAPVQALYHYAMLLDDEGRPEEAVKYLEAAFEKSQEHHIVHRLGILKEKTRDYRGAIKFYELALQDVSNPIPVLHGIADCYHFLGEYRECVRVLTRAILIDSQDRISWTNLGYALDQLGMEGVSFICFYVLQRAPKGDSISDEEVQAAVDELLSRLRVEFGEDFVTAIEREVRIP